MTDAPTHTAHAGARLTYYGVGLALSLASCLVAVDVAFVGHPDSLLLAVGGVVAMLLSFRLRVEWKTRRSEGASWSLNGALEAFILLAAGPFAALPIVATAFLVRDTWRRRPPAIVLRNIINEVAAISAAGTFYIATGGSPGRAELPVDFIPALGAAVLLVVVFNLVFSVDSAVHDAAPMVTFKDEVRNFRSSLHLDLLEALSGASVAIVWATDRWLVPLLLPFAYSVFLVMKKSTEVHEVTDRALEGFANIVDERDRYTFEHSTRVCEYSMWIGEELGLSEVELKSLYWTSRLHDLGKVAVDNSILNKPGKLTDEEFEVMKSHPVVSARILSAFSFSPAETDIVLCHHERVDGRGYLRREADTIPLEAYIIAVADTYDAMTSDRPYRKGMEPGIALAEIHRNIGTQFHAGAAVAFLTLMARKGVHAVDADILKGVFAPLGSMGSDLPKIVPGDDIREAA